MREVYRSWEHLVVFNFLPLLPGCRELGCQGFNYGLRGNRRVVARSGIGLSLLQASSFDAQSLVPVSEGWRYEVADKVTKDPTDHTMACDGQGRHVAFCISELPNGCVKQAGSGRTLYGYDGEGRRANKALASGVTTTYVYDTLGRLAANYGGTPSVTGGRVYLTPKAQGW
jgi:YD repeat-containing protein